MVAPNNLSNHIERRRPSGRRIAHATQRTVHSLLIFTRLVRANLMHRRPIDRLLEPPPPLTKDQRQWTFDLCQH
jgi:hypothetical protein